MKLCDYIGLPYRWHGEGGHDCWTLVRAVLGDSGAQLPAPEYPADDYATLAALVEENARRWQAVEHPRHLDVIRMGQHHIGVYLNEGILHAVPKRGVILQPIKAIRRIYRPLRFYRWVG